MMLLLSKGNDTYSRGREGERERGECREEYKQIMILIAYALTT